ncbi:MULTISPECIES: metallophosphoesterase [unclassified Myxococcus]|uniref:metallophosphoesterase n=1 Tax=unclassified Myxococcus TaxID=2648731 RepID=UPI00157A417B|nr:MULTISPECIES: metallophosphoesterase [unclassified Myxococcus]NTX39184.1 metallophosphoesterase [Myxococcus sp. CA033]NTX54902.1 metallophosphoesterase [Myxococcus sp. CA039A]
MRTVILSDLHLGNGGRYDIFAGGEELAALLQSLTSTPTRVVLNGDTFDFLLDEEPLQLDVSRAVRQASALVRHPQTSRVMTALGKVLLKGGEAIVTVGNHDLELALPQVQQVLREALQQPDGGSRKLTFQVGTEPLLLTVGGARVLVVHGEQDDDFNRVDHAKLLARTCDPSTPFRYPPGSLLVKELLNPLKAQERMRYMDLLKPDVEGAVLTALGANPAAVKTVLKPAALKIVVGLLRNRGLRAAYSNDGELADEWAGLGARLEEAELTPPETQALAEALEATGPASFDGDDVLEDARRKLMRAGLTCYARLHRRMVGYQGVAYFDLEPDSGEVERAGRLARRHGGAQAVVMGHTHSARWKAEPGFVFANTGTWIWLLRTPAPDASAADWRDFLLELQDNPSLEPTRLRHAHPQGRFTYVSVEPLEASGATMRLVQWEQGAALPPLQEATLLVPGSAGNP